MEVKARKGRPPKKLSPITEEERNRLVDEFLAAGGKVQKLPMAGSVGPSSTRKPSGSISKQVPWHEHAVRSVKSEGDES